MALGTGARIRVADIGDAAAIANVHVRSWQVAYRGMMPDSLLDGLSVPKRTAQWLKHLEERDEVTLVSETDGRIAGWATFGQSQDDGALLNAGELYGIYLDPAAWGKGLGAGLYREAERRLRAAEFSEATLWVIEQNIRARAFYAAVGYAADGATRTKQREGVAEPEIHVRYRKAFEESAGQRAIRVRKATPADDAFARGTYFATQRWIIEQLFGWRGDEVERKKFYEHYAVDRTKIVEIDGAPVGWFDVVEAPMHLDLAGVYIIPEFQNQGIGTALVRRLTNNARMAEKRLKLGTAKINPARRLYQRLGFHDVSEDEYKVYMQLGDPPTASA